MAARADKKTTPKFALSCKAFNKKVRREKHRADLMIVVAAKRKFVTDLRCREFRAFFFVL